MKINYRQQHNSKRRTMRILLVVVILVTFVGLLLNNSTSRIMQSAYAYTAISVNYTKNMIGGIFGIFTPKQSLLQENQALRTKVQRLEISALYTKALEVENAKLRKLPKDMRNSDILARIINYRDIPYGTLLARVESTEQAKLHIGALAHFDKLAIGKVIRINNNILTIKLLTSSGSAYDVLIGDSLGTLIGMSNGTGKIVLPRTEKIELGAVVALPSAAGLVVGIVKNIDREIEESYQTLLIHVPLNIKDLRFLTIDSN